MRAVANLFIARSRAAVFWFVVTCGSLASSAVYVQSVIKDVRTLPQFVMAGSADLYYLTPDLQADDVKSIHASQTRLAMETIYNRGPSGLDHQERRFNLFTDEVNATINNEVIAPQVLMFRDTKSQQKVEIEKIDVNLAEGKGEATTVGYGQLIRTGVEGNQTVNKAFSVKVFFSWKSNPNPEEHALYPTICNNVSFFSTIQTFP